MMPRAVTGALVRADVDPDGVPLLVLDLYREHDDPGPVAIFAITEATAVELVRAIASWRRSLPAARAA